MSPRISHDSTALTNQLEDPSIIGPPVHVPQPGFVACLSADVVDEVYGILVIRVKEWNWSVVPAKNQCYNVAH
jgi:hypothetical protein